MEWKLFETTRRHVGIENVHIRKRMREKQKNLDFFSHFACTFFFRSRPFGTNFTQDRFERDNSKRQMALLASRNGFTCKCFFFSFPLPMCVCAGAGTGLVKCGKKTILWHWQTSSMLAAMAVLGMVRSMAIVHATAHYYRFCVHIADSSFWFFFYPKLTTSLAVRSQ